MQPTGTSMRILLVDDVQLDRMQLAIRLKQLGHIVKAVGSGLEALNTYESFDRNGVTRYINARYERF